MVMEEGTRSPLQSPTSLKQLLEQQPTADPEISRPSPTFSADLVGKNISEPSLGSGSRKDTTPKGKRAIRALPPIPLDPPTAIANSGISTASSRKLPTLHSKASEPSVVSATGGSSHKGVRLPDSSKSMPHTRSDQHHSSSSRRSKHGSGRHRRLLTELLHLYPHLNQRASERTEASGSSSLNGFDPSPTDSHSHRTHSQPFRQSSASTSEILIMTTEKLHIETARANAAEKQIADVMSLFKNTHDQKVKLEGELSRIRGELGWYKVQLDVAQKEIFRAQEIVERVDRQRVEAEEAVVRAREKSRKLSEARAVDLAMEEGRRLGFEEGLKHGRIMAQISESERPRSKSRTASAGGSGSRKSQPVSQSELPESSKAYKSSARPQRRPPSRTTANDGTTLTTQPVIVDPKRGRRLSRPEEIAIQDRDAPRSKSNYRQSPDVSRRSIVLPPDNYIPVLNPDATITLPPPHEMTVPVPPEAPTSFAPRASGTQTPLNRPRSRSGPITSRSGEPPSYSPGDIQAPIPRRAASPIRDGPSNSVTKMASESTEQRSPSTYPNRPPRRTREIVMPIPLGNHFLPGRTTGGLAHLLPQIADPPEPSPSKDPPTPPHTVRMASYTTIPDINVQTPSSKSARSDRTALDPVLLTPEYVDKPLSSHEEQQGEVLGLYTEPPKVATPVQLPSSFVPLSPIPGMANLNPYPVGLNSKDHSLTKDSNYVYPSSPLVRPT